MTPEAGQELRPESKALVALERSRPTRDGRKDRGRGLLALGLILGGVLTLLWAGALIWGAAELVAWLLS